MRKIITYGTFDLLHLGHINLLRRAKELGDYLIVAVSTDEFNELKGKKTIQPYEEREEIIKSLKFVDEVIPEKSWQQKAEDIKRYGVDVFTIGNDWEGRFDNLKSYCEVIYLERTKNISSTQIKNKLENINFLSSKLENLSKEDLQQIKFILDKIVDLK